MFTLAHIPAVRWQKWASFSKVSHDLEVVEEPKRQRQVNEKGGGQLLEEETELRAHACPENQENINANLRQCSSS